MKVFTDVVGLLVIIAAIYGYLYKKNDRVFWLYFSPIACFNGVLTCILNFESHFFKVLFFLNLLFAVLTSFNLVKYFLNRNKEK